MCDAVLPGMRQRSHTYNLVMRERGNASVVVLQLPSRRVVGGTTFKLVRSPATGHVVLDVVLMAVAQEEGVCGRGLGTSLANAAKAVGRHFADADADADAAPSPTQAQSKSQPRANAHSLSTAPPPSSRRKRRAGAPLHCCAQADNSAMAVNFWAKQGLAATPAALELARTLCRADPHFKLYTDAVPMLATLAPSGGGATAAKDSAGGALAAALVPLTISQRAQDEVHNEGGRVVVCLCGGEVDELEVVDAALVRCDLCGTYQHVACALDNNVVPDLYVCFQCATPRLRSSHAAGDGADKVAPARAAAARVRAATARDKSDVRCSECGQVCRGTRGLAAHQRHAHTADAGLDLHTAAAPAVPPAAATGSQGAPVANCEQTAVTATAGAASLHLRAWPSAAAIRRASTAAFSAKDPSKGGTAAVAVPPASAASVVSAPLPRPQPLPQPTVRASSNAVESLWQALAAAQKEIQSGHVGTSATLSKHPTLGKPLSFVWRMNKAAEEDQPNLYKGPDAAHLWQRSALKMQGELSIWRQADPDTCRAFLSANFLAAVRRWLCAGRVCSNNTALWQADGVAPSALIPRRTIFALTPPPPIFSYPNPFAFFQQRFP